MIKKIKGILPAMLVAGGALAQESSNNFDLTSAASAATEIKTAVTGFFSSSVGPLVLGIGGAVFAVSMILVAIRWGRKPTGGR